MQMSNEKILSKYIMDEIHALRGVDFRVVEEICEYIRKTTTKRGILWAAGNGGSATTAAHFVTDISKGVFVSTGVKFRAICLNEGLGIQTAWSNDFSYEDSLAHTFESLSSNHDLLIVFSGSGNSPNIVKLVEKANFLGIHSIGILGFDGGKVSQLLSTRLIVNSNDMQIVENVHLFICHAIFKLLI